MNDTTPAPLPDDAAARASLDRGLTLLERFTEQEIDDLGYTLLYISRAAREQRNTGGAR